MLQKFGPSYNSIMETRRQPGYFSDFRCQLNQKVSDSPFFDVFLWRSSKVYHMHFVAIKIIKRIIWEIFPKHGADLIVEVLVANG